jgi:anaerobic nitric oxide reductase transcription regulator
VRVIHISHITHPDANQSINELTTELLRDLTQELPASERFQHCVERLRHVFHCGAVALLRLEEGALRPVAAAGLVHEALGRQFQVPQHPRLSVLLASQQPVCFAQDSTLPDPYDGLLEACVGEALPVHDCMGMRLTIDGESWGLVTLDALETGTFDANAQLALEHLQPLLETLVRVTSLETNYHRLATLASRTPTRLGEVIDNQAILGTSEAIQQLLSELDVVAASDLTILLLGETGVGKELFAHRLHLHSNRAGRPLVHVNCAALPESLAESELFGHCKGAFSGASQDRPGRIETAHGSTLFLDEVSELPLPVQAKLLRTLQNGEIQRLGEDQPRRVDVRVIAATNRDLRQLVRDGRFRADLYHRLSVYPMPIPPLRERGHDILLLAGHFLELNRARLGLRSLRLTPPAEAALLSHHWPGNVRELEHVISRAALKALSKGASRQEIISLDTRLLDIDASELAMPDRLHPEPSTELPVMEPGMSLKTMTEHVQRQWIQQSLTQHDNNWAACARALQLDASNLHKLAKKLGLK